MNAQPSTGLSAARTYKLPSYYVALFPMLKGIEEYPVFLRFSGKRFCKKFALGFYTEPSELSAIQPSMVRKLDYFALIFGPALLVVSIIRKRDLSDMLDAGYQISGPLSLTLLRIYWSCFFLALTCGASFLVNILSTSLKSTVRGTMAYGEPNHTHAVSWAQEISLSSLSRMDLLLGLAGASLVRNAAILSLYISMMVSMALGIPIMGIGDLLAHAQTSNEIIWLVWTNTVHWFYFSLALAGVCFGNLHAGFNFAQSLESNNRTTRSRFWVMFQNRIPLFAAMLIWGIFRLILRDHLKFHDFLLFAAPYAIFSWLAARRACRKAVLHLSPSPSLDVDFIPVGSR